MADNSKELLEQLHHLEKGLSQFSFQSLTAEEAKKLKIEFNSFGHQLKDHLWGEPVAESTDGTQDSGRKQSWKLLAEVGHEIRTPLAGIVNMTDLLRDSDLDSQQNQWVVAIHKAAQSLLNLSSEILELSAIGSQRGPKKQVEFNLPALINDQVFLCKTLLLNKDVELIASIDSTIPTRLWGDASSLSQILLNILGNAVKYVEHGKIKFDVRMTRTKESLHFLEFRISDTGIGIADEELERIFEAYSQAEHQREGKGLGLAIVKELVEQMGGCLAVESVLGEGSTFSVILPFSQSGPVQLEKSTLKPIRKKGKEVDLTGKHILLIEDDSLQQRWLQHRLSEVGAEISTAFKAKKGLQFLQQKKFDLVLLDCKLPDFSGWELLENIRANGTLLPQVVLCSAQWTEEEEKRAQALGIHFSLEKPFAGTELLETIQRALNNETVKPQKSLVDLTNLHQECQGNIDLLEELAQLFKQNILEFIGQTRIHLQARNPQGISFAAHKVKSSLQMIQSETLYALCDELDEGAKCNEPLGYLQGLYEEFLELYPATERALEWAITQIKTSN